MTAGKVIVAVCLLMLGTPTMASAGDAPRTGSYSTTFNQGSPLSAWAAFADHAGSAFGGGSKTSPDADPYQISTESFDVYVPSSYDGSQAYGLIGYVSPNTGGGPPGDYIQILNDRKIIWIGAANVPNSRNPISRGRLTVDGVFNICKLYRIDTDRIYVAGLSGGGRVASRIAIPYADVFTGGAFFFCGCDPVTMPSDSNVAHEVMALAQEQRFALMTGSDDFNRPGTKDVFAQYQSMKLPQAKYFEEPGLGHGMPSAAWFGDAVTYVDTPLIAKAAALLATGKADAAKRRWRQAWNAFKSVSGSTIATTAAKEALPLLTEAAQKLDAEAASDLERIMVKPQSVQLRQFALKWPAELPSTVKARAEAERLGGEEIDKLAAAKPTAMALRSFLRTWEGYDVCTRALAALDVLAKESWSKVEAMKPGGPRTRVIVKFIREWAPTPTSTSAGDTLKTDVQAELTKIDALPNADAKNSKLQSLLKEVAGSPASAMVEAALAALTAGPGQKKD